MSAELVGLCWVCIPHFRWGCLVCWLAGVPGLILHQGFGIFWLLSAGHLPLGWLSSCAGARPPFPLHLMFSGVVVSHFHSVPLGCLVCYFTDGLWALGRARLPWLMFRCVAHRLVLGSSCLGQSCPVVALVFLVPVFCCGLKVHLSSLGLSGWKCVCFPFPGTICHLSRGVFAYVCGHAGLFNAVLGSIGVASFGHVFILLFFVWLFLFLGCSLK